MHLTSLLKQLSVDHPTITFAKSEHFFWSPSTTTIFYEEDGDPFLLLHELGHALLHHTDYERDVQLVAMERAAWEKARALAPLYLADNGDIPENTIEAHLDTYRDWLHARSTCPNCTATGYQSGAHTYTCPACTQTWRVNDARICQLRRTKL